MDNDVMSRCPVCGARVYIDAGSPTPAHQADGADDGQCPGTGQPSK